ncbi:MAG: NnrU family protein [Rhodanobacteraceae bacterium]
MSLLIIGLIIFLSVHSVRIFADDWRAQQIEHFGLKRWKGLYSLVSIVGFVLLIWGFGLARQHPVVLYTPPAFLRHLNALFTLVAFVLVAAAYAPRNHLQAAIGHPMLAGVKVWAVGHLLATGMLHDVVLFGAFLLWAIVNFAASRRRDRRAGTTYAPGAMTGDAVTIVVGVAVWIAFALWLHILLIGVDPLA